MATPPTFVWLRSISLILCCSLLAVVISACSDDGGGGSSTAVFRDESLITSTAPTMAVTDEAWSYTVTAEGSPRPTISVEGLPSWLSLSANTLSGTPTAADEGESAPITITASNGYGAADTQEFTITVAPALAPSFTSSAIRSATEGVVYSYTPALGGNPLPSLYVSNLPDWMMFDGSTLWGTPGTADLGTTQQIVLTARNSKGETATQLFSVTVSPAMGMPATLPFDFNGDGVNDVVMGAYRNPLNGPWSGRVYIFFGGPNLTGDLSATNADLILTGESEQAAFGFSVGSAGDLNGDGFSDVMIGSPGYNNDAGRVYVFMGRADPLPSMFASNADLIFDGEAPGDRLGSDVGSAGDVNADGYSDFLMGAQESSASLNFAGSAYLFLGRNSMTGNWSVGDADVAFDGVLEGENFGITLASAGDVNGDGFDDVLIGADQEGTGGFGLGRAYLFLGGLSLYGNVRVRATLADTTFVGNTGGDRVGISLASGDVNGDGMSDMVVGANGSDLAGNATGSVFIFFGRSDFGGQELIDVANADATITGETDGDALGVAVAVIGDIDGDGAEDMLLGASGSDLGGIDSGRAYVFAGDPNLIGTVSVNSGQASFIGEDTLYRLGFAIASAGDINGDGVSDLLLGAYRHDNPQPLRGSVYVFHGGPTLNGNINAADAEVKITSQSPRDYLGFSVSGGR